MTNSGTENENPTFYSTKITEALDDHILGNEHERTPRCTDGLGRVRHEALAQTEKIQE